MTLSDFYCERCQDKRASSSNPRGFLEFTILPLLLIRHVRCDYCGDRFATFGFGKSRVVFSRSFTKFVRGAALILLYAVVVGGAVAFIILR